MFNSIIIYIYHYSIIIIISTKLLVHASSRILGDPRRYHPLPRNSRNRLLKLPHPGSPGSQAGCFWGYPMGFAGPFPIKVEFKHWKYGNVVGKPWWFMMIYPVISGYLMGISNEDMGTYMGISSEKWWTYGISTGMNNGDLWWFILCETRQWKSQCFYMVFLHVFSGKNIEQNF